MTTLKDSKLVKVYNYITAQRVIGENLNNFTLIYKSDVDGQTFQDLTEKLNGIVINNEDIEVWVYIVKTRSSTIGFKTIVRGEQLIECYMFSLTLGRRFYSYLDKTTVHSYYPNGIDLFDDIGYGCIYEPKFYSNRCSFRSIMGYLLLGRQFFINNIELYRMVNRVEDVPITDPNLDITNLTYQLSYETRSKLMSLNSDILQYDNLNMFESLITRLDNIMLYAQLKQNTPVDLIHVDFKRLTDRDNILIMYKLSNNHIFALYIPRIDYNCIDDYNKYRQLTLYSITFNSVIPFSDWTIRIDKTNRDELITLTTYDLIFKPIKIHNNYTIPISIDYNTIHLTPELTIEDIFGEHETMEGRHATERIEMDCIDIEIYLVGRDDLVNTNSKKEHLDIMN